MKLTAPKPPALNRLYGHNRYGSVYLKKEGKQWKDDFYYLVKATKTAQMIGELSLRVDLYTCKRQDNDGILKLLQDSLTFSGVIEDDYYIFDLRVVKHKCKKCDEKVEIELTEIA